MTSTLWVRPRSDLPSARGTSRAMTQQILVEPISSTVTSEVRPGCTGLRRAVRASVIMVLLGPGFGFAFGRGLVVRGALDRMLVVLPVRGDLGSGEFTRLQRDDARHAQVDQRHVAIEQRVVGLVH